MFGVQRSMFNVPRPSAHYVLFGDAVAVFDGVEDIVDDVFGDVAVPSAGRIVDEDGAAFADIHTAGGSDFDAFEHAVLYLTLKVGKEVDGFFLVADARWFAVGTETTTDEEMMFGCVHDDWMFGDTRYEIRDARCEIRDARCEIRATRCEIRATRCEIRAT